MRKQRVLSCLFLALSSACVTQLPEQDMRILEVKNVSAKLTAADLWKDFQQNAASAKSTYFGKAIDVSDKPTALEPDATKGQQIYFGQTNEHGVRARLLDSRAAEILKEAKVGARITLRCYCEGLDDKQDVILKSCIRP
jgi:tRNA_anti-like